MRQTDLHLIRSRDSSKVLRAKIQTSIKTGKETTLTFGPETLGVKIRVAIKITRILPIDHESLTPPRELQLLTPINNHQRHPHSTRPLHSLENDSVCLHIKVKNLICILGTKVQ